MAARSLTSPCQLLLKLALNACERNDPAGASEALRAALALEPRTEPTSGEPQAVSIGALAKLLGYCPRQIRTMIAEGEIPAEAVLSRGRRTRVLVETAIEGLRSSRTGSRRPVDDVEKEGMEHVERRRFRPSPRKRASKE